MKKLLCKAISVLLVITMLLPLNIAFTFAGSTDDYPVFSVSKISETTTEIKLMFSLKSGKFSCFDGTVNIEGLTCKSAITTDEYDAYEKNLKINGAQVLSVPNKDNGKMSIASTAIISAPIDITIYTFTKKTADGIKASDIKVNIDDCYISADNNDVIEITEHAVITVELAAEHTHAASGTWTVTKPATCSAEGEEVSYCTECGQIAATRPIAKLAHANTYVDEKAATCEADGYKDTYCRDCNQCISHQVMPATGHKNTYEERVEATCTTAGYVKTFCKDCGKLINTVNLPAKGHGETINERVEPTCTAAGYEKSYCKDCGEVFSSKTLPAKGHGQTREERVEATCTAAGYVKTYCKDCGTLINTVTIPAKGHSEPKVERKEPTCTEDGYIKKTCSVCGVELEATVVLKAPGHNVLTDKVAATCTEAGYIKHYCDRCGTQLDYTTIPAEGHKLVTDQKNATCHEAGYLRILCSKCGLIKVNTVMPKLTHEWTSWSTVKEPTYCSTGISRRSCRLCGDAEEEVIPMIVVKPTAITLSTDNIKLNYKQNAILYATVAPEEATYTAQITWKSSNEKVCKVDENGNITTTGRGTAVVTAYADNGRLSASCNVTVEYTLIQKIIIYVLFGWIWYK